MYYSTCWFESSKTASGFQQTAFGKLGHLIMVGITEEETKKSWRLEEKLPMSANKLILEQAIAPLGYACMNSMQ